MASNNPNVKANLTSTNYTKEQMRELGRQMQAKGLITKQQRKEEQQSLCELYKAICNSKVVKKLVPENVQAYAEAQGIKLDNKKALAIVQYLKAVQGDNDSYRIVTQAIGEDPALQLQAQQTYNNIDLQRYQSYVLQILDKWLDDKDLLHAIVVDIEHIKM